MKSHRSNKRKISVSLENITAFFFRDGDSYVAYMPTLDLTTCGESLEEAEKMAKEASLLFIEECIRMKTLDEVLSSLGWSKQKSTREWMPPAYIAHQSLNLSSSAQIH